jgi:AcrR family transcriptional regulator
MEGRRALKAKAVRGTEASKRAVGRPRCEKARRAILKAAFSLLKRDGFDGVSTQQIARKAGVSTATLYRWWENKEAVLLDAYMETTRDILPQGDGGSPLRRLRRYTIRVAAFLKGPNGLVFQRLLMTLQDNPALRKAFYKNVFLPQEAEGCAVVRKAIEAGELPSSVDPHLLINLLAGPQVFSALLGRNLNRKSAERIFDFILHAASYVD